MMKLVGLGHATPSSDTSRIQYYREALSIATTRKDTLSQGRIYAILLVRSKSDGRYPEAFEYGQKALKAYRSIEYYKGIAGVYNELSAIYIIQHKYEEGLALLQEGYELLREKKPSRELIRLMCNISFYAYIKHKKYTEAQTLITEALGYAKQINNRENIIHCYTLLLKVCIDSNGEVAQADCQSYADSIAAIYPKLGPKITKRYTAAHMLSYYYSEQNDRTFAFKYARLALASAKDMRRKHNIAEAYAHLFEVYLKFGEHDLAINALNESHKVKDSIFNEKSLAKLQTLETQFKTEKAIQDKELAEEKAKLAEEKAKSYQNWLIAILIFCLMVLVSIAFYIWLYRLRKQKELVSKELSSTQERLEVEQQFRQAELKALKAQLNPHFMFNALNSIQDYILLNEKELASDYLGKFADLMRIYLNHSQEGNLSLEEEIEALELYLDLESVRFDHSIEFNIKTDGNLDIDDLKIPTMLVQPYVENAVKHGLFYKKGERKIDVQFKEHNDDYLEAIVRDNGIGREASAEINKKRNPNHKSFATSANATRLHLLNHGRSQKIEVKFVDLYQDQKATGTEVRILIPLKQTA
ncbi:MAG: hypothetical protein GY810_16210 [Aureispira sp.]|nr:hypothetical protein [Aureispira sp.]